MGGCPTIRESEGGGFLGGGVEGVPRGKQKGGRGKGEERWGWSHAGGRGG